MPTTNLSDSHTDDLGETIIVDTVLFDIPDSRVKVDGGQTTSLKMAANRYRVAGAPVEDGVTLLFTHANGLHKEAWEPVLQTLLVPQNSTSTTVTKPEVRIREAWAFDAPDHGDSAVANQAALKHLPEGVSTVEAAKGIAWFVETHLLSHQVVPIGHSVGCVAIVYSMMCFKPEIRIPYKSMIVIEPPMNDRQLRDEHYEDRTRHMALLAKAVGAQRSTFDSREAAYEWMCKRSPWKIWDDRVRRIYANNGFRPVDPIVPLGPVTAKCSKIHEVGKYSEWDPMLIAVDHITNTCDKFPYHFVFGAVNDIVPRYVQDNVVSAERGRRVASVTRIPGVGHMIVQQAPEALAAVITGLLNKSFKQRDTASKHHL